MYPAILRHAEPEDIPAILAILTGCRAELPALSEEGLIPLLRRNIRRRSVMLAETNGITAAVVVWSPPLSRISLLAVLPEFRGRHLASRLLQAALDQLPDQDVSVETFTDSDPRGIAARALYHKFGFRSEQPLDGYDTPMVKLKLRRN